MGPIDYSGGMQPANPMQAGLQGFAVGDAFRQRQLAQQQAQQAAMEKAQQEQELQAELDGLATKPGGGTVADYAMLMTRRPGLTKQLQVPMEALSKEQQQNALDHSSQVLTALSRKQPEVAARMLEERAQGMENKGDTKGAERARAMAETARTNPQALMPTFAGLVMALPGGDKVIEGITKMGAEGRAEALAPSALRESEAKATTAEASAQYAGPKALAEKDEAVAKASTAGVTAKYAERGALLELEKRGWEVKKLKADTAYQAENRRILSMQHAERKETDELQKRKLRAEISAAEDKQSGIIRERVDKAEQGAASIDNMLNTIQRLKKNPALRDVVGALEGSDLYPTTAAALLSAPGLTTSADLRADAIALFETLKSQAFMAQIPGIAGKGLGALSNEEGKKIESSFQNLSRKQGEPQVRATLDEAERLLMKGREQLSKSTGVPLKKPDVPAGPGGRPALDSFFK